eukprot:scaffold11077_cov78-Cyclotella_meneghiniana.AAC.8
MSFDEANEKRIEWIAGAKWAMQGDNFTRGKKQWRVGSQKQWTENLFAPSKSNVGFTAMVNGVAEAVAIEFVRGSGRRILICALTEFKCIRGRHAGTVKAVDINRGNGEWGHIGSGNRIRSWQWPSNSCFGAVLSSRQLRSKAGPRQ